MSIQQHLPIPLLTRLVEGGLEIGEEETASAHLDVCPTCRIALEQATAEPEWWQEASALLKIDEDDLPPVGREEWSANDFSIDFLDPADDPELLGKLGDYEIHSVLGRGGMGVVLKARDRQLNRFVAIKVLGPQWASSDLARRRFVREAEAAAAVVHPNVIAIHQVQAHGRLPFLVMSLVPGESLQQRLAARGPLELVEVLRIGMQAAAGLSAAHDQGLVHRDVKPANILLEPGIERVVLTDFGLARAADDRAMTQWGIIVGTPAYMSPEQSRGEQLDGTSDLFSLGCVVYEMATGQPPFQAEGTLALLRQICEGNVAPPSSVRNDLPRWFDRIVLQLLSKDAGERFPTAKSVAKLLEQCLSHLQNPANPLPADFKDSTSSSWRTSITVAVVLLVIAIWLAFREPLPIRHQESSERVEQTVDELEAPPQQQQPVETQIPSNQYMKPFDPAWNAVDREAREIRARLEALERPMSQ